MFIKVEMSTVNPVSQSLNPPPSHHFHSRKAQAPFLIKTEKSRAILRLSYCYEQIFPARIRGGVEELVDRVVALSETLAPDDASCEESDAYFEEAWLGGVGDGFCDGVRSLAPAALCHNSSHSPVCLRLFAPSTYDHAVVFLRRSDLDLCVLLLRVPDFVEHGTLAIRHQLLLCQYQAKLKGTRLLRAIGSGLVFPG